MNLLLDTCALLALAAGELPEAAADALRNATTVLIPPVVPWELAIKVRAGKLQLPEPALPYVRALSVRYRLDPPAGNMDAELLCAAADLPLIHRDPIDRILIATAIRLNLTLLTSDRTIRTYPGVKTLW